MTDIIDAANDRAQSDLDANIKAARAVGSALPETGFCHNCTDPIEAGKFCDSDCRDDWQKRNPHA